MIKITIPLKDKFIDNLDNANYIYLYCSDHTENYVLESNGYMIGNITFKKNIDISVFNIYVDNKPSIYTFDGESLVHADMLEKYLIESKDFELHFESSSYIKIVEKGSLLTFHGIYSCIKDATNYVNHIYNHNTRDFFEFISQGNEGVNSKI